MSTLRDKISLRFWMDAGPTLTGVAAVFESWWDKIETRLGWINRQIDPETAPLELVNLLAWERDVTRLNNEPETLFRLRVKYALANAKDAGCMAGFLRIWGRLNLGYLGQSERVDAENWDVIELEMTENLISQQPDLLTEIIRQYGRTCRRYTFVTITPVPATIRPIVFEHMVIQSAAIRDDDATATATTRAAHFDHDNEYLTAIA